MSRYGVMSMKDSLVLEGARAGTRAVVLRFSGCNLWDGAPLRRSDAFAPCAAYCDSDHYRGTPVDLADLLASAEEDWPAAEAKEAGHQRWLHLTGGEPMVQVNREFMEAFLSAGWAISCETNGTLASDLYDGFDHLVVSPKPGLHIACDVRRAHEVRAVYPGAGGRFDGWKDEDLLVLADRLRARHRYVAPMDPPLDPDQVGTSLLRGGADLEEGDDVGTFAATLYQSSLTQCVAFVRKHPGWRLALPVSKLAGLEG